MPLTLFIIHLCIFLPQLPLLTSLSLSPQFNPSAQASSARSIALHADKSSTLGRGEHLLDSTSDAVPSGENSVDNLLEAIAAQGVIPQNDWTQELGALGERGHEEGLEEGIERLYNDHFASQAQASAIVSEASSSADDSSMKGRSRKRFLASSKSSNLDLVELANIVNSGNRANPSLPFTNGDSNDVSSATRNSSGDQTGSSMSDNSSIQIEEAMDVLDAFIMQWEESSKNTSSPSPKRESPPSSGL